MTDLVKKDKSIGESELASSKESSGVAWLPPINAAASISSLSAINLSKIAQVKKPPSVLMRIRQTRIGLIYLKYLKPIPVVRRLVLRSWSHLLSMQTIFSMFFGSSEVKRWRPLIKLADYVSVTQTRTIPVFDAVRVDTPVPKVYPVEDSSYLNSPRDHYVFPSVYVAELDSALVYGSTNLVFTDKGAICHDLYDFAHDFTSEEMHGQHTIDVQNLRMRRLLCDKNPVKLPVAAAFVDACAQNYAHWLTEVLPRIAAFCTLKQFSYIPLIIDDGLHANIMESLILIAGSNRKIISLPLGQAVQVDKLYQTSVAGYVPFERRKNSKLAGHSHGYFCPPALQTIQAFCLSQIKNVQAAHWPRNIYLRRVSGVRNITNNSEVEEILSDNGYAIVEPQKLSFSEQFVLFNNADSIFGSSGAALANLVFAPTAAKIHVFISKSKDTSYWYWPNIANSCEKEIIYILGTALNKYDGIHSDFKVEVQSLTQTLGDKS